MKTVWYTTLAVMLLAGAWGIGQRLIDGMAATHITSQVGWGVWVTFYIFFVGLSAGSFLVSSLAFVFGDSRYERIGRDALLVAILSMGLATCFISLDLGRIERLWHTVWYMNITSILAWEVRFYGLYITLMLAELWLSMRTDLIRLAAGETGFKGRLAKFLSFGQTDTSDQSVKRDHRWLKILGAVGIPVAIFGVHGGTGSLFAVVKAMPYWHSGLFPVLFVVSALVSGTALLLFIHLTRSRCQERQIDLEVMRGLSSLLLLFLAIDLTLEFYEFFIAAYGMKEQELATLQIMFTGPMKWVFWLIQLGLGAALPIFLLTHSSRKHSPDSVAFASLAVICGILGVRFNIVLPPHLIAKLPGLPAGVYSPSLVEIASSLGVIAGGIVCYLLAVRLLPIDPPFSAGTRPGLCETRQAVHM